MGKHAGGFHARRMMNYIGRGVTSENLLSADHPRRHGGIHLGRWSLSGYATTEGVPITELLSEA